MEHISLCCSRSGLMLKHARCRGFTALSETLGRMVAGLHQAFILAMQQESNLAVLGGQLRALQALLLTAPYHRLPASLLSSASEVPTVPPAPHVAPTQSGSWLQNQCHAQLCILLCLEGKCRGPEHSLPTCLPACTCYPRTGVRTAAGCVDQGSSAASCRGRGRLGS